MNAVSPMIVPIIETTRLILREYRRSDFDPIAAHWQSDRTKHTGGPLNRRDAWKAFAGDCGQWHLRGYGMWIVQDKASGDTAGYVGFYEPDHYSETELGWVLLAPFEGKGLADEAVHSDFQSGNTPSLPP